MKFVNFLQGNQIRLGMKTNQGIIDVQKAAETYSIEVPATIEEVINGGESVLSKLSELAEQAEPTVAEEGLVYAPAVTNPEKIICVGLNYIDHAKESNMDIPSHPVLFSKFNNALAAHHQAISLPDDAEKFDYEAELVIVMGREARKVSKEEALSYVFGYTVGNDFSARDLQFRSGQWLLGKTCDDFAPVGPYIVTSDEVGSTKFRYQVHGKWRSTSVS